MIVIIILDSQCFLVFVQLGNKSYGLQSKFNSIGSIIYFINIYEKCAFVDISCSSTLYMQEKIRVDREIALLWF